MKLKMAIIPGYLEAVFANYDRVDEKTIYDTAVDVLRGRPDVILERELMGPSEDVTPGTYLGEKFTLIHDLDYGTSIRCDSPGILDALVKVLEA